MAPKRADAIGDADIIVNDSTSSSTFSTKAPRLRTAEDWPDSEKPKAKRGRKKKVATDDDSATTESSSE